MYKVGIDTGGTHTDIILANVETGEAFSTKVSTTPDLIEGVSNGIRQVISIAGLPPEQIRELIYGTTIVVNMIAQRQLGHTALITTRGFRDILEIGRAFREKNIYDIQMEKPECLIQRHLRYEVTERVDFRGQVLIPLNPEEVRDVVRELKRQRESRPLRCAFCMLTSTQPTSKRFAASSRGNTRRSYILPFVGG